MEYSPRGMEPGSRQAGKTYRLPRKLLHRVKTHVYRAAPDKVRSQREELACLEILYRTVPRTVVAVARNCSLAARKRNLILCLCCSCEQQQLRLDIHIIGAPITPFYLLPFTSYLIKLRPINRNFGDGREKCGI